MAEIQNSSNKFVTFNLGKEEFGIQISYIRKIIKYTNITSVPNTPNFIKGIINNRGAVIPVLDLRIRLNFAEKSDFENSNIILLLNEKISKIEKRHARIYPI